MTKIVKTFGYRVLEIAVAICALAAILYISDKVQQRWRASVSPTAWFTVNDIYVPDHPAGTSPQITLDRTVKESFQAYWIVEIQRRDGDNNFQLVCTANGVRAYDPETMRGQRTLDWSKFANGRCRTLAPGSYRVRLTLIMKRPDWPEKTIIAYSNTFRVEARS